MTVSPDQVEETELTILSRLVECQRLLSLGMDELLAAKKYREWDFYLTRYWMVIQTRLRYADKLAKTIEGIKEKDPHWSLAKYLHLDASVSQP